MGDKGFEKSFLCHKPDPQVFLENSYFQCQMLTHLQMLMKHKEVSFLKDVMYVMFMLPTLFL